MNSLPKTITRQHYNCDLNPGPSAPESNMLTTRLPSHPTVQYLDNMQQLQLKVINYHQMSVRLLQLVRCLSNYRTNPQVSNTNKQEKDNY